MAETSHPRAFLAAANTTAATGEGTAVEAIWSALIGAGAALLGTLVTPWLQSRRELQRYEREVAQRFIQARRAAYAQLLQAADAIYSHVGGILAAGRGQIPDEVAESLLSAIPEAEIHATADSWARMKPCTEAIAMMANAVQTMSYNRAKAREVTQVLRERGYDRPEDWNRLRNEMVAAMRDDLRPGDLGRC